MRKHVRVLGPLFLVTGCLGDIEQPHSSVAIEVSALSLSGVAEVVYDLEVRNGAAPSEIVWQRRITSTRFGDGAGSASFVGTCDADANPNTVRLWVVGVYDQAIGAPGDFAEGADTAIGPASLDFQNPTSDTPLSLEVACQADADNAVGFDLTLVRPAQQGFFDIAMTFNDIFCSAKFDCCDPQGGGGCDDLMLLFDADGARGKTFVLGFACTAGTAGAVDTELYMDALALDCDVNSSAGTFVADLTIDPGLGSAGNLCTAGPDGMSACAPTVVEAANVDADAYLFQAATFRGAEELTLAGGGSAQKVYWNVALGVKSPAIAQCRLQTRATADDAADAGDNASGGIIAAGTVYPAVSWDVALGSCTAEALTFGDPAAPVRATYTSTGATAPDPFDYTFNPPAAPRAVCLPACPAGGSCVAPQACEVACTGLPDHAVWNSVGAVPQVWDGAAWLPTTAGVFDSTPSTTACRFVCAPNYVWTGSACVPLASPPSLVAVVPEHGAVAGGDLVELVGFNLVAGATVTFGGVPSPEVTVNSSTLVTVPNAMAAVARVPAGLGPGPVDVTLVNPDTGTATVIAGYTYGAALTVRSCYATGYFGAGGSRSKTAVFTADDCGGALPDPTDVGSVNRSYGTSGVMQSAVVDGAAPAMRVYRTVDSQTYYALGAVYLPAADVVMCSQGGDPGSGATGRLYFTPADCGGAWPDPVTHVGGLKQLEPCNGAITFMTDDDAGLGPSVYWYSYYGTVCNPAYVAATYFKRDDVILCDRSGSASGTGAKTIDFTAADCGGVLPDEQYVGVLKHMTVCGGVIAYRATHGPNPGVWMWSKSSYCGAYRIAVAYIRR